MCIWFGSWTGTRVPETLSRLRESRFNKDLRRCQDCENRELIHAGAQQRHRDILITDVPELPTRDPCSPPLATRNSSHKSVVSLHTCPDRGAKCPDRGRKHHISHITHTLHTLTYTTTTKCPFIMGRKQQRKAKNMYKQLEMVEKNIRHTYIRTTPTTQTKKKNCHFTSLGRFHSLSTRSLSSETKHKTVQKYIFHGCCCCFDRGVCLFEEKRWKNEWKNERNGKCRNPYNITLFHTQTQTLSHEIRQNITNETYLHTPNTTQKHVKHLFEQRKMKNDLEKFVEKNRVLRGFPPTTRQQMVGFWEWKTWNRWNQT